MASSDIRGCILRVQIYAPGSVMSTYQCASSLRLPRQSENLGTWRVAVRRRRERLGHVIYFVLSSLLSVMRIVLFPDQDIRRASVTYPSLSLPGFNRDWVRNYFDSLEFRRMGRSLRKPDQGKQSPERLRICWVTIVTSRLFAE